MKKEIICLIFLFIILFSPALWGEKTIDQKIADLEKKLPTVIGKETKIKGLLPEKQPLILCGKLL